jgi:hypothetical protein
MLEGKLGEFSLPDIFQLLTLTKKSGSLHVDAGTTLGRVWFRDGQVYFAMANVRRMALGARLVSAGLVTEEQLSQVLAARNGAGAGAVARELVERSIVDGATLDEFIRGQIEDAIFDLMRLEDGDFLFDATDDTDAPVGLNVSTEHLIVEGTHRLEEWSAIRRHVPSSEQVLAMVPAAPDEQITLTAEQWRLLILVDGTRTVRDIVELHGKGEFGTSRLLSELVQARLVEACDPEEGPTTLARMLERRAGLRRLEELELGPPEPSEDPTPAAEQAPAQPPEPKPEPPAPAEVGVRDLVAGGDGGSSPTQPAAPDVDGNGNGNGHDGPSRLDRAQVVRELASLGYDDLAPALAPDGGADEDEDMIGEPVPRLTRDEDVNKGLLVRLIDGVKGA